MLKDAQRTAAARTLYLSGIVLLAAPAAVYANSGIGYFMVLMPVMVAALLPVIPLEAVVLMRLLELPFKRALYLSFIANLWSTIIGIVLGVAIDLVLMSASGTSGFDFTRVAALVMLVPMFFISVWLEFDVIRKRLAEAPASRVRRATLAANLLSYVAMMAFAWVLLPQHSPTQLRAYISQALSAAGSLKEPVQAFRAKHQRFPADGKELGEAPPASTHHTVTLESNGRITVRIRRPDVPELNGRQVVLWPVMVGETLVWKCASPDIEPRHLPASCRERTP